MKFAAFCTSGTKNNTRLAGSWYVLAFGSETSRDDYVAAASKTFIAARAITKKEISQYVKAPRPFSGEKRAIGLAAREIPGLLGEVCVIHPEDANYIRDL